MVGPDTNYTAAIKAIQLGQSIVADITADHGGYTPKPMPVLPPQQSGVAQTSFPNGIPRSIAKSAEVDLTMEYAPYSIINAAYLGYVNPPRARIIYSDNLDQDWKRFWICKEASHMLLADSGNMTGSAEAAIDLISSLIVMNPVTVSAAEMTEHAAYFAATELLLPQQRQEEIEKMFANGATSQDVAREFKVPENAVDFRWRSDVRSTFDDAYAQAPTESS